MRRKLLFELWTHFMCLASVASLLVAALVILVDIDGWLAYETGGQLATEIGARVAIALGLAVLFATASAFLTLPYVLWRAASAPARQAKVLRAANLTVLVVCCSAIVGIGIRWVAAVHLLSLTNRTSIRLWVWLSGLLLLGALAQYFLSGQEEEWVSRCARSMSGQKTRRFLMLAGVGSLLTGLSLGRDERSAAPRVRGSNVSASRPNLLLVTFDALSAEDMSCYGYRLPTTPNIDLLASSSYVFRNYYAVSTFTTPCITSMVTGCYPSSNHVYHFGGMLRGEAAQRTVSRVLRDRGYTTAASVANPGAHPADLGFGSDFDILPSPPVTDFATRDVSMLFRSAQLADDVRRGTDFVPYLLEQLSPHLWGRIHSTTPPRKSFQQAEEILRDLRGPYFLWVHVMAPHFPYLPEPPYLRRFLHTDELRTHAEFADMVDRTGYSYSPAKQPLIDKGRLRYDEWLAQADGAFGEFMARLRAAGHLTNTAVIVSADHGESFQGGFLGHGGYQQLRPIVHVPLIVHLPGQDSRQEIAAPVDQTLLAPTLLGIAGIDPPAWMSGPSLQSVRRVDAAAATAAFTQFFVTNSAFKPIKHGTIGVIDDRHQYLLDLDSGAGALFDLAEAHEQRINLAGAEPALANAYREQIQRRFPEIFGRAS